MSSPIEQGATAIDWQRHSACRAFADNRMYPEYPSYTDRADDPDQFTQDVHLYHQAVTAAKQVCAACPVQQNCLSHALNTGEEFGVWGGFTHKEIQRLKAGATAHNCNRCRLPFVPSVEDTRRCAGCRCLPSDDEQQQGRTHVMLEGRRRQAANEYDPDLIDLVEEGQARFGLLTLAERVALWKRHHAEGGSRTQFVRRYAVNTESLRRLRKAAAQQTQAVAA